MVVSLKNNRGKDLSLNFETDLKKIPLAKKVDFDIGYEDIALWMLEEIEAKTIGENTPVYLVKMVKLLSSYFDVDFDDLFQLDFSSFMTEDGELNTEKIVKHFEGIQDFDVVSFEKTIVWLFEKLNQVLGAYKGELRIDKEFRFKYKDVDSDQIIDWVIPEVSKEALTGKLRFGKISTEESIRILNIKRWANNQYKDKDDIDLKGNLRYTRFLKTIAILADREINGEIEKFPLETQEINERVDKRTFHFANIDCKTGLDIIFFLSHTMNPLPKTLN